MWSVLNVVSAMGKFPMFEVQSIAITMSACCIYLVCHADPFWAVIASSQGVVQQLKKRNTNLYSCKKYIQKLSQKSFSTKKKNDVRVFESPKAIPPLHSLPAFPGEPLLGKRAFRSKHPKKAVTSGSRTWSRWHRWHLDIALRCGPLPVTMATRHSTVRRMKHPIYQNCWLKLTLENPV